MATDSPTAKSDTPFFRNNALAILNSIMVGLLHDPNSTLSMPEIHRLVHSGKEGLCCWLECHPHALRNTRTFVELARSGSQNADTILSELSMRLAAWDLTAIRATTFLEELDLETLIEKPTLFIIELRESEVEMLRPMANVIIVEVLRFLTKRAERCPGQTLPRPVGLVIDEFASALGRLPDIHVKLNTLRSRNVSIVGSIQSIAQIKANYKEDADSVIAGFNTKILMPMLDFQDAEWASKETGTMTVRYKTANDGKNRRIIDNFASVNRGFMEQVQQRPVLTPDEIGRAMGNVATFFMPNTPVFQGHLVPYYKVPEINGNIEKYNTPDFEYQLREAPLDYEEKLPDAIYHDANGQVIENPNNQPTMSDEELAMALFEAKKVLDWENAMDPAKEWWEAFEDQNIERLPLVLALAQELIKRSATINDFFTAYVYSDTESVQETLNYLDNMKNTPAAQAAA